MIKVSVLYPWTPGASFDMDYYCTKHMALVRKRFGKAVKGIAVDEGVAGETAASKPPYIAIGHVLFELARRPPEGVRRARRGGDGRHPQLHDHRADHPDQRGASVAPGTRSARMPSATA